MAETVVNNKSFADSVNLIADLDSTYSKNVYITRSNIQLNNQTYVATATLDIFDSSVILINSVIVKTRNVVGNAQLESFMSDVKTELELMFDTFTMTYTVTPNGSDFSIRADVVSTDILIKSFNIKFVIGSFTKYDLYSGSDDYIKILPFLSSIGHEAIAAMKNVSPVSAELKAIGPAIQYLAAVANNVAGINAVGQNISGVNSLAPVASSIGALVPYRDNIRDLSENVNVLRDLNGNIPDIMALTGSIAAINVLSNRLVELETVNDNIAEIVAVANSVYPNIERILAAEDYASSALLNKNLSEGHRNGARDYYNLAKRFATEMSGEVESGLYSAKYYAEESKAASVTPAGLLSKIKTIDGVASGLDADLLDGYQSSVLPKSSTVPIRDGGARIHANSTSVNSVQFARHSSLDMFGSNTILEHGSESLYLYDIESLDPSGYLSMPKYRLDGSIFGNRKDIDAFTDVYKRIANHTGVAINSLSAVEFVSSNGTATSVKPAVAVAGISNRLFGVTIYTLSPLAINIGGLACRSGHIRSVNTSGSQFGESWSNGNKIYLKPGTLTGQLTNIEPGSGDIKIFIGIVIRAHATSGILDVTITNINENEYINTATLVTAASINAYNKTEVDNKFSAFGTIADFEGALL